MQHEVTLGEYLSAEIKEGYRIAKGIFFGDVDTRTAKELSPFGIDSRPTDKDVLAVYATTSSDDEPVIIGYLFKGKLEAVAAGETRLFSSKADGTLAAYIWCRNDGNLELQGDDDFAVRYSKLESEFNELKGVLNDLVGKWNSFATDYLPGSPSATGMPSTLASATVTESSADITGAKITNIKVNKNNPA